MTNRGARSCHGSGRPWFVHRVYAAAPPQGTSGPRPPVSTARIRQETPPASAHWRGRARCAQNRSPASRSQHVVEPKGRQARPGAAWLRFHRQVYWPGFPNGFRAGPSQRLQQCEFIDTDVCRQVPQPRPHPKSPIARIAGAQFWPIGDRARILDSDDRMDAQGPRHVGSSADLPDDHARGHEPVWPPCRRERLRLRPNPERGGHARGAGWVAERASALGAAAGEAEWQEHAYLANKHDPVLKSHDRFGHRIDAVEFHPSYHALMCLAFGSGVHSLAWTANRPGAHTARAALSYLWNQIENGVGCPTGMAYSSIPSLRRVTAIRDHWEDKERAEGYDARPIPVTEKSAATIGMALTEKQGGSDLRANATRAIAVSGGGPGGEYRLTGHKWFCSAPMSDAFLTLAQTEKGPSCFFVPRSLPDR